MAVAPFFGFVLAGRVFDLGPDGDWEVWKAALIGGLLSVPFAAGAHFGMRSVLKGFHAGWFGLLANLALGLLAVTMPVLEALAS